MRNRLIISAVAIMSLYPAIAFAESTMLSDDTKELVDDTKKVVPLPEDVDKKVIPVEPPTLEGKPVNKDNPNAVILPIEESDSITEDELKDTKTLMFKPSDHEKIIKVFNSYRNKIRGKTKGKASSKEAEDLLSEALSKIGDQKDVPAEVIKVPAYFYLESIIFHKGQKPRIWVNGKKLQPEEEYNGLKLLSATDSQANFLWKVPPGVDVSEWEARAKDNKKSESKIEVDTAIAEVRFGLKVNQWFDATKTAVVEGRTMSRLGITDADPIFYDPSKKKIEEKVEVPEAPIDPTAAPLPEGDKNIAGEEIKESFPIGTDKHYNVMVDVGGKKEVFKVDTGATITSIPKSVAETLGINTKKLNYTQTVETAGGKINVASTKIPEIKVGKLSVKDLEIWVFDDKNLSVSLLGQNFLNQFDSETKNGVLTLTKR